MNAIEFILCWSFNDRHGTCLCLNLTSTSKETLLEQNYLYLASSCQMGIGSGLGVVAYAYLAFKSRTS